MSEMGHEIPLIGGGRTTVTRGNQVVYREGGPWSVTVISLLRHLETCGFTGAPLIVGTGFDDRGRETLSFIEGDFVHPAPRTDEAFSEIGSMLWRLHDAAASFTIPANAIWRDWFGRGLGDGPFVIGTATPGLGTLFVAPISLLR